MGWLLGLALGAAPFFEWSSGFIRGLGDVRCRVSPTRETCTKVIQCLRRRRSSIARMVSALFSGTVELVRPDDARGGGQWCPLAPCTGRCWCAVRARMIA